jgi:transcriptional regulator with XRE-family HTH domain
MRKRDRFRVPAGLGPRLRELRHRAGMRQSDVAKPVGRGRDQSLVSRLEAGYLRDSMFDSYRACDCLQQGAGRAQLLLLMWVQYCVPEIPLGLTATPRRPTRPAKCRA